MLVTQKKALLELISRLSIKIKKKSYKKYSNQMHIGHLFKFFFKKQQQTFFALM